MQTHHLETDFLVAGGGMSGVAAAIAAARNGTKVILIQDRSMLGGNASSEVRMHIVGADCHGGKPGLRESGIMEELKLDDAVRNPHRSYAQWDLLLYEKVKLEPNITLFLDTFVCAVEMDGDVIRSAKAIRHLTEDEFIITAKFFADCTGDGRLGAEAGADCQIGREGRAQFNEPTAQEVGDRQTLGSSILLTGRKYDTPQPYIAPSWVRTFKESDFKYRSINSYEYGYWWFEWGGQLDTIKDNETIRHELLRITLGVWNYVKNSGKYPDAANWALDWVGSIPAKRESRRFLGPHILTEHDIRNTAVVDDAVAYGGWWIDTHPPMGVDAPDERPCIQHHFDHIYGIPFGCYHSRNVANLLFAGRNISATHIAFASTRVMATCAVGGQAIGNAVALWKDGAESDVRKLATPQNIQALQQSLLRDDAFLPGIKNSDTRDLALSAAFFADSGAGTAALAAGAYTRDLLAKYGDWSTDVAQAWSSETLPATLTATLPAPAKVREISITFDTGFKRELILTPSDHHTSSVIRGPQPETVCDYRVLVDGKVVTEVTGNVQRHCVHTLAEPVEATRISVECLRTHGVNIARIFNLRIYA